MHNLLYDIGDAELASIAAGLAVGEPKDAPSIADSAIGRSSIVSGTTAGVTQFSEVSLINISCTSYLINMYSLLRIYVIEI